MSNKGYLDLEVLLLVKFVKLRSTVCDPILEIPYEPRMRDFDRYGREIQSP